MQWNVLEFNRVESSHRVATKAKRLEHCKIHGKNVIYQQDLGILNPRIEDPWILKIMNSFNFLGFKDPES